MRLMLTALIVAACLMGSPAFASDGAAPNITARVAVMRDGDLWTAEYELARDAPVWVFQRSALSRVGRRPWRPQQWVIETPGVILERRGFHEVLRREDGGPLPRRVRVRLIPATVDLEADYDPALLFTGGAVALYTGHFDVIPLDTLAQADALPADLNGVDLSSGGDTEIVWRDGAGPILHNGQRYSSATTRGVGAYVLFGEAGVVEGEGVTTVIDTAMPGWITEELGAFAPRLFELYAARLGPKPDGVPMIMASWNGPTPGRRSMGGSVLPNLISMTFEGVGVLEATPEVLAQARWFIGHEAAHFWLGQAVRYEFARDAWITEGGADLSAVRALQALDPSYDARSELQREVDQCITLSRDRAVADAAGRGEHRAFYACGAVFSLVAEGAQRRLDGGDWFDWLRPLIAANREDGILTRAEWLDQLTRTSGDPSLTRDIEGMLDDGAADPGAVIGGLFERSGVAFDMVEGRPVLK